MTSGFFHLGVYALDGGSWEGPVSWRKPVVFSLSFGIAGYVVLIGAGLVGHVQRPHAGAHTP